MADQQSFGDLRVNTFLTVLNHGISTTPNKEDIIMTINEKIDDLNPIIHEYELDEPPKLVRTLCDDGTGSSYLVSEEHKQMRKFLKKLIKEFFEDFDIDAIKSVQIDFFRSKLGNVKMNKWIRDKFE
jgi:hypothetical protein